MRESILALLAAWSQAHAAQPFYTTLIGVGVGLTALSLVGSRFCARTHHKAEAAGGPLLFLAALPVFALCMLWAGIDGLLLWRDAPLLGERLLHLLIPASLEVPGAPELGQIFGLPKGTTSLPSGVTMPLGLLAATGLQMAVAWALGSTLAELIALQKKPDDIILWERQKKLEAERKAREQARADASADAGEHAGQAADATAGAAEKDQGPENQPVPDTASVPLAEHERDAADAAAEGPRAPLPDDRMGVLYKLCGHFHDHVKVEYRFLRWKNPLVLGLAGLLGMAAFAAASGYLPVPLWVGSAVLVVALQKLGSAGQARKDDQAKHPGQDPGQSEQAGNLAIPRPAFAERVDIASHLRPAPRPSLPVPRTQTPELHGQRLMSDILSALGAKRLHGHQAAAMAAFQARTSVLIATPPESGRELLADAVALHAVLGEAERVLHLSPDAALARSAKARFDARADATHWKWNVLAVNLAERAGIIDPSQSQPTLVFADPDIVHRQLCGQSERWQTFLAGLGAIIVPDVHLYSGVRAGHLAHLLRRLVRAIERSRSPWLGSHTQAKPLPAGQPEAVRFVLTASPGHANLGRYAERITGRSVEVIGPELDGAPRPRHDARIIDTGWDLGALHPALGLCDLARRMGYEPALHGYDDVITALETQGHADARTAEVVICRLNAATHASLPVETMHLGATRPTRRGLVPSVAVLWQADPGPLAQLLARQEKNVLEWNLGSGRALVAWPGAPWVERSHIHATLAESEVSEDELTSVFSRPVVEHELAELRAQGRLIERTQRLLDAGAGAVRDITTWHMSTTDDVHAATGLGTTGESWHVCERSTGKILFEIESARGLAAAYPHRVFVTRGRRFAVLGHEDQTALGQKRVLCEQTDAAVVSVPIRTWLIELVERRKQDAGDPALERRRGALRSIGGARFSLEHRQVMVTETLSGLRRFDLRGRLLDATLYDEPIVCTFESRAAVLGFVPGELPGGEDTTSGPVLHALEHGFGEALGALLRYREDDLDIAPLARTDIWSVPSLAFVDLHPGGAGFADAITLDVIRELVRWSLALMRHCPFACKEGCASCLHTWTCRAPAEHYQRVDKQGAQALLTALLGAGASTPA